MPHVDISMFPGRDEQTKLELAKKIHQFIVDELNVKETVVSVSVRDIPKEDWTKHIKSYSEEEMLVKPQY